MNRTNDSESLCDETKKIMYTDQMEVILVLECLVGVVAVFPNILALVLLWRVKVFHSNLRVLLGHLSLDLLVYSVTLAEKALRRLLTPMCRLVIFFPTCVVMEWAIGIPLHNATLSVVVLLLERVYATFRFRTYENGKKQPYLAVGLLTCSWISTLSIQFTNYANAPEVMVPICDVGLSSNPSQVAAIMATFVLLETVASALLVFVFIYNRHLLRATVVNRAQFDLSARFQVDQNVSVNKALVPSAVLHVICHLPNYTFLLFTLIDALSPSITIPLKTRAWFLHSSFLWRLIYAFAHPILLVTLNPSLKQELCRSRLGNAVIFLRRCGGIRTEDATATSAAVTDAHFRYLEKSWRQPMK